MTTNAAIYARHSSDKQSSSTQDQIARCKKYCTAKAWNIVGVFSDEAISGSHMLNRPGIIGLMDASLDTGFDVIVAEDLSRISRDQSDVATIYKKLDFLGIRIETISDGLINELHIGLKGTMNALYIKDPADKTRRGMIASVLKGHIPGGRIYGYDLALGLDPSGGLLRGMRTINIEQADGVRQIFSDYVNGATLQEICRELNVCGIAAPRGKEWHATTLIGTLSRQTGILRNTLYKGVVTFNRMLYRKHPETGKRVSILNPASEWIQVPVPELAILEDGVFDAAQELIEKRSTMRKVRSEQAASRTSEEEKSHATTLSRTWRSRQIQSTNPFRIFSGRMWCAFHRKRITARYGGVFGCPESRCPNHKLSIGDVMPAIIEDMASLTPEGITASLQHPDLKASRDRLERKKAGCAERIDDLRSRVHNILVAMGKGEKITQQVKDYLFDAERDIKRAQLEERDISAELLDLTVPDNLSSVLKAFSSTLGRLRFDPAEPGFHQRYRPAFRRFVLHATWNDRQATWDRSCKVDIDHVTLLRLMRQG